MQIFRGICQLSWKLPKVRVVRSKNLYRWKLFIASFTFVFTLVFISLLRAWCRPFWGSCCLLNHCEHFCRIWTDIGSVPVALHVVDYRDMAWRVRKMSGNFTIHGDWLAAFSCLYQWPFLGERGVCRLPLHSDVWWCKICLSLDDLPDANQRNHSYFLKPLTVS